MSKYKDKDTTKKDTTDKNPNNQRQDLIDDYSQKSIKEFKMFKSF